jgi:hypothetical protein
MLGKELGYYPEDPVESWRVDSIIDADLDVIYRSVFLTA